MSARRALFISVLATLAACERQAEAPDEAMDPAALEQSEEERLREQQEQAGQELKRQQEQSRRQIEEQQRAAERQAGAAVRPLSGAPLQLAQARCEREQRCGNIGPDETYASQAACLERVGQDWAEDLNARECPEGIVQDEFAECLDEIRNEDCNNPFDTLERVVACRASDICNAAP